MTDQDWERERDEAAEKYAEPYACPSTPERMCKHDIICAFKAGYDFGRERGLADLEKRVESANQTNHLKQMINQELQRQRDELKVELEAVKTGKGIANPYILKDELIKDLTAEVEHLREVVSYLPKVPTEPYEKEMAKEIVELTAKLAEAERKSKEIFGPAGHKHVGEIMNERDRWRTLALELGEQLKLASGLLEMTVSHNSCQAKMIWPDKDKVDSLLARLEELKGSVE